MAPVNALFVPTYNKFRMEKIDMNMMNGKKMRLFLAFISFPSVKCAQNVPTEPHMSI